MLCVRCKKRPAIVFVQKLEAKSEAYCLSCARELGIKPVDDIMKQFGISDQDLEAMEERFAGMMENGDMDPAAMMQQLGMMAPPDDADGDEAPDDDTDEGGDGDFTPGGNATFPFGIFGGRRKAEEAPEKEAKSKNDRGKKRKFLDNYCINLSQRARDGKLEEVFGTGTAAVVSPVKELVWKGEHAYIGDGKIGPVTQKLYDTMTGMQWGKIPDTKGWIVPVEKKY